MKPKRIILSFTPEEYARLDYLRNLRDFNTIEELINALTEVELKKNEETNSNS